VKLSPSHETFFPASFIVDIPPIGPNTQPHHNRRYTFHLPPFPSRPAAHVPVHGQFTCTTHTPASPHSPLHSCTYTPQPRNHPSPLKARRILSNHPRRCLPSAAVVRNTTL
jgi:hypothetical protein